MVVGGDSFLFFSSILNLINIFGQLEPNDLLYYSLFVHQLDQKHLPDLLFRGVIQLGRYYE